MPALTIASYNVLADAYLRPEWFAAVDPTHLDPSWRRPALARRILTLDADVIGLQEVEGPVFEALEAILAPQGYSGHFAQKNQERPDGAAFFVRQTVDVRSVSALHYDDGLRGAEPSGHVALILTGRWLGREVLIATTHLRFGAAHQRGADHIGYRQLTQLLDATEDDGTSRIIGGDFNVTPDHHMIRELTDRGFVDVYRDHPGAVTCCANHRAQRIDYLMHEPALTSAAVTIPTIDDHTVLPHADEPSDHLPIAARLHWVS